MKVSAGLLLTRWVDAFPEVVLVHPGGPLWARKDDGWWTLPKGLVEPGEAHLDTAIRELREETGWSVAGPFVSLGFVDQSRKRVFAWASVADIDPSTLVSEPVEMEWPPRSGIRASFPEVDRAGWFAPLDATRKILPAQAPFLLRVMDAWNTGALAR